MFICVHVCLCVGHEYYASSIHATEGLESRVVIKRTDNNENLFTRVIYAFDLDHPGGCARLHVVVYCLVAGLYSVLGFLPAVGCGS